MRAVSSIWLVALALLQVSLTTAQKKRTPSCPAPVTTVSATTTNTPTFGICACPKISKICAPGEPPAPTGSATSTVAEYQAGDCTATVNVALGDAGGCNGACPTCLEPTATGAQTSCTSYATMTTQVPEVVCLRGFKGKRIACQPVTSVCKPDEPTGKVRSMIAATTLGCTVEVEWQGGACDYCPTCKNPSAWPTGAWPTGARPTGSK